MKKFIVNFLLFFLLIFLLQSLLGRYELEFKELKLLKTYLKENVQILFIGDCTNYFCDTDDRDSRTIVEMLQDRCSQFSVRGISHAAYQMDLYLELCKYIIRLKKKPEIIIFPVNMRSFSPDWDKRPQYQFEKEKIILQEGLMSYLLSSFYKPLRVLNYNFFSISRKEFENTSVFKGKKKVGKVKDFNNLNYRKVSEKNKKNKFLFYYMYSLTRKHRKIKSMLQIAKILSFNNIQLIFYVTPIDFESGEDYFPNQFITQLHDNTKMICDLLRKRKVHILDLSMDLKTEFFSWRMYPNEQLDQEGRKFVAERLSDKIKASRDNI